MFFVVESVVLWYLITHPLIIMLTVMVYMIIGGGIVFGILNEDAEARVKQLSFFKKDAGTMTRPQTYQFLFVVMFAWWYVMYLDLSGKGKTLVVQEVHCTIN